MSRIKFNHVFAALLVVSALSAFVIPPRYTARAQSQVQSLFYPVARPVRSVAGWTAERLAKRETKSQRDVQTLLEEKDALEQEVTALSETLRRMMEREEERKLVGPIGERCTIFQVVGPTLGAGGREGLALRGSSLDGLRQGQPVVFSGGVVGRIDEPPGLAGAQVRLITDRGFRIGAYFVRFEPGQGPQRVDTPPALMEGMGDGVMRCVTKMSMDEVKNLQINDWVVIDDREWDDDVQNRRLGHVVYKAPQAENQLWADIRVKPSKSLVRLTQVMVVTKK